MDNNQPTSSRIDWIDISKGIAIFLMVYGHASIPVFMSKIIWSFHMPLFFILSGLLFKPEKYTNFYHFFKKRVKSLLIPYICFTIIVIFVNYLNDVELVWKYNDGWGGYPLWFIEVLFTAELVMYWVIRLSKSIRIFIVAISLFLIAGYILYIYDFHLSFKQDVVFWACFFYGFGYAIRNIVNNILNIKWYYAMIFIIGSFVACQILPKTDMCGNQYGYLIVNSLIAIIVSFSIFTLSSKWQYGLFKPIREIFIWGGQNTITIMGVSMLLQREVVDLTINFPLPNIIGFTLRQIIIWGLLYLITVDLKKYLPFVIGK